MNKYEEGDFGYWWTEIEGNPDIEGQVYNGNIYCSNKNLTSLKGCPEIINGYFSCSYNELTSLKFCPEIINGDFSCSYNELISLEFCTKQINGNFHCSYNNLTSLKYCPKQIKGSFYCYNTKIKDKNEFKKIKFCKNIYSDFDNDEIMNFIKENSPEYYI